MRLQTNSHFLSPHLGLIICSCSCGCSHDDWQMQLASIWFKVHGPNMRKQPLQAATAATTATKISLLRWLQPFYISQSPIDANATCAFRLK